MEQYFGITNVQGNYRVTLAAAYLKDNAMTWWIAKTRQNTQPGTWTQFKVQIKEQFLILDDATKAR